MGNEPSGLKDNDSNTNIHTGREDEQQLSLNPSPSRLGRGGRIGALIRGQSRNSKGMQGESSLGSSFDLDDNASAATNGRNNIQHSASSSSDRKLKLQQKFQQRRQWSQTRKGNKDNNEAGQGNDTNNLPVPPPPNNLVDIMSPYKSSKTSGVNSDLSREMGGLSLQSTRDGVKTTATDDVDQWDKNWNDDEESSSDDDDDDDEEDTNSANAAMTAQNSSAIQMNGATAVGVPPPHPTFRQGMDGSHSSALPSHYGQHQQHFSLPSIPPEGQTIEKEPPEHRRTDSELNVLKTVNQVIGEGVNGVQWDTNANANIYEKPNPSMFSPFRVLGKGSFGKVVLVQKHGGNECGKLFAMKCLRKTHLLRRGQIERTKTERKVLSLVDHPFIMKLHFAFQTDDKLFLVLDYCAGGELFFHLTRQRRFPEKYTRFYAAELLLALGHCHSKGIIYRDLKPENVLLDSDGHVKLGDFGLAKDNVRHPYKGATSLCGTPEYMAPEILQQLGHGFCVDYWGVGMLTYEMLTGLPPWYTTDRQLLYRRLKSAPLDIPEFFSPKASSFVYSLLQRDPRRRLGVRGARAVMSHDFFRGLDFRMIIHKRVNAPIRPCDAWNQVQNEATQNNNNSSMTSTTSIQSETSFTTNGVSSSITTTAAPISPLRPGVGSSPSPSPQRGPVQQQQSQQQQQQQQQQQMNKNDIDAITSYFDEQFLRMPIESDGHENDDGNNSMDDADSNELNDETFVGFTFDEQNDV